MFSGKDIKNLISFLLLSAHLPLPKTPDTGLELANSSAPLLPAPSLRWMGTSPITGKATPSTGLGKNSPASPKALLTSMEKAEAVQLPTASAWLQDGVYIEPIPVCFLEEIYIFGSAE